MAAAFSGPYVDTSLSTRAPFSQTAAPAPVTNPRDLSANRAYTVDQVAPARSQDYTSQQADPKPFPGAVSESSSYYPYANGGGVSSFLANSGS